MKLHLPKFLILISLAWLTGVQATHARKLISASLFGTKVYVNPPGWTFTGVNMNINIICSSTGYAGASSGANLSEGCSVPFTNSAGTYMQNSQIGSSTAKLLISTLNYSNIRLSFAMRKSSKNVSNLSTYQLEWSINDTSYFPVNFQVSSRTNWNLAKGSGLTLPAGAEHQPTLYLRWTFNRTSIHTNIKIDDFKVKGDSICTPVSIIAEPINPFPVCANSGIVTFTVTAAGSGNITYQWQKDSINIFDGGIYNGTHSATITISNPDYFQTGSKFRCIVSNCSGGYAQTSDEAELTVKTLKSDISKDGITDNNDFILFIQNYNASCTGCAEDINNDGVVNVFDFLKMLSEYNRTCE